MPKAKKVTLISYPAGKILSVVTEAKADKVCAERERRIRAAERKRNASQR